MENVKQAYKKFEQKLWAVDVVDVISRWWDKVEERSDLMQLAITTDITSIMTEITHTCHWSPSVHS